MPTMNFGRRRVDWLLLIAVACAVLAWAFTRFGAEVTAGNLAGIDVAVRRFVIAHQSEVARTFFDGITFLGSKPVLVVVGVLVGWWVSNRSVVLLVLLAVLGMASAEFVDFLKEGFGIPRPPTTASPSRSLSFPSGHVSGATAIGTLLSYVAWRRKIAERVITTVCALLVILMALSRIYLDRHWTSDTLGGALIGATLGLTCCALYEWLDRTAQQSGARH